MLQLILFGSTQRAYRPSALISRTRSRWLSGQYSAERRKIPSFPMGTRLSFIILSLCSTRSNGRILGGARPKLLGRPSTSPSDARLMTFGLLSVELPSSVDRELFLDTMFFFMFRDSSLSWLRVLKSEDLGRDRGSRGELKGEDSAEEVVSLSVVPCLFRVYPLGDSLAVRVFRLKDEGEEEGEEQEEVEGDSLEHVLDLLLGRSRGTPQDPGSLWNRDSFRRVWGLSRRVQKP